MALGMCGEAGCLDGRGVGNARQHQRQYQQQSRRCVNPMERAEVSRAVYGILRDNLPAALESQTTPQELALVANSIEAKLYATASSPRAYCALSTVEFRITALATAVLIHSDKGPQGISDTCARLSAAARKSLVYCVMVLVSYEKKNVEKASIRSNGGIVSQQRGNATNNLGRSRQDNRARRSSNASSRMIDDTTHYQQQAARQVDTSNVRSRTMEEMHSQRATDRMTEEMYSQQARTGDLSHLRCQFEEKITDHANGEESSANNAQLVVDGGKRRQWPFPPSA